MGDVHAVIFDLDGVLCSTDRLHFLAWKHLADCLGITLASDVKDRIRGVSRAESLEIVLGSQGDAYTAEQKAKFAQEKNEEYRRMLRCMTPSNQNDGAREVLDYLRTHGIKTALGSASCNAPLIVEKIGLAGAFDYLVDGSMVHASKPDPEVFVLVAKGLREEPGCCMVVEDAYAGIEAAARGGFIPVAFGLDAARHERAMYRISSLREIPLLVLPKAQSMTDPIITPETK